ncbi:hypothetical protein V470_11090 [Streptococcus sp. VT 162]|nr:hypothetical protein V470_11090 [Streptococcus sp. VT 162]
MYSSRRRSSSSHKGSSTGFKRDTEHVYEKVKTSHKDKEGNDIPGYPTDEVPVTPPTPDEPEIKKDVNGKESATLGTNLQGNT